MPVSETLVAARQTFDAQSKTFAADDQSLRGVCERFQKHLSSSTNLYAVFIKDYRNICRPQSMFTRPHAALPGVYERFQKTFVVEILTRPYAVFTRPYAAFTRPDTALRGVYERFQKHLSLP